MAAREHRETHYVAQTEKMIPLVTQKLSLVRMSAEKLIMLKQTVKVVPFITGEDAFGQQVSQLVAGVNIIDLDLRFQVNSVEQPIKSNSVGPGNMSHCGASSSNDHLDHCFVVFKHIQQSFLTRRIDV